MLAASAGLLLCLLIVRVAGAQSILEFDRWMKVIEKRNLSVQRNLKAKNAAGAVADATEMRELYVRMEQYFVEHGVAEDAAVRTRDGITQISAVIVSATSGDFDQALTTAIDVSAACRDCHLEYKPLR